MLHLFRWRPRTRLSNTSAWLSLSTFWFGNGCNLGKCHNAREPQALHVEREDVENFHNRFCGLSEVQREVRNRRHSLKTTGANITHYRTPLHVPACVNMYPRVMLLPCSGGVPALPVILSALTWKVFDLANGGETMTNPGIQWGSIAAGAWVAQPRPMTAHGLRGLCLQTYDDLAQHRAQHIQYHLALPDFCFQNLQSTNA